MRKLSAAALLIPVFFSFSSAQEVIKIKKITVAEEILPQESVGEVKEATEEEIKTTRQIDLGEILSGIFPEINHIRKGGTANDIVLRGFGKDNLNVLIDGMRIYNACPNRMDPAIFHISSPQVKEVQILEGPFDVSNQGSLAGVVNVKSKDPEKGIFGSVNITGGFFDYISGNIQINAGTDRFKVLAGYGKQFSHPYQSGEGKKITEYPEGMSGYKPSEINHTAFNIDSAWVKTVFNLNSENEIKISYAFDEAKDVLYPYLKMDGVYDRTHSVIGEYEIKPLKLKVTGYWNFIRHDMQDRWRKSAIPWTDGTMSTRGYMMRTLAKSKTYGAKIEKSFKVFGIGFKAGIDGYVRNWKADNIVKTVNNKGMIPDVDIKNIGAYLQGAKKIKNFIVSAGIRFDNTKSEADKNALGTDNRGLYGLYYGTNYSLSKTDSYISGNIVLRYKFDKRNSAYIGFGHTVRVPDPEERYIALKKPMTKPNWVGNPNLDTVKNNEVDAGIEYYWGLFSLKGNIFYSDLTDYVYLTVVQNDAPKPAQSYQNIDAHIYGGDINLTGVLNENLSVELGVAYQRGKKDSGNYTDSDLAEIPPLKTRLAFKYDTGSFYSILEGIYSGKQDNVDTDLKEIETKSYFVANLKLGYVVSGKASINIGIDNIFDKNYYTHLSYLRNPFSTGTKIPEPGRFVYMNVSLMF
ncbi:MAG: TonB-dependent receptor [Aquificota bacterium]|nr:MAG: TonB-dependent receptor [Aquificota bacterium]